MRMLVMRSGRTVCLLLVLSTFCITAQGQNFFPTELDMDSFEQSYSRLDIGKLEISELVRKADLGGRSLTDEDPTQLIRRNVSYIIFHRLNRERLYSVPDGQYIVNKASEIYGILNEIESLIEKGRGMQDSQRLVGGAGTAQLLEDLKDRARSLRKKFRQYFVELNETQYEFELSAEQNPSVVLANYLDECEKVNSELKNTLDRFFFNPRPGVVTVEDYTSYSVALLSRSLEVLSDSFSDRLHR